MKPSKGLSSDHKKLEQPEGTYPFGKNGVWNANTNAIQNEKGFRVSSAQIPYTIIGIIETDTNPIIFSTDDTYSAIGFYDEETDTYDSRVNDQFLSYKLGFKRTNYIKGEARRNYKNHVEAAWLDKLNPVRFADLDELPTNLSNYLIFPEYEQPVLKLDIVAGGTLGMGSYFAGVKYTNSDGTETRYSTLSPPVFATAVNFAALPGTSTGKSLKITLTNLDTRYTHVQIVIVRRIKGVTTAVELPAVVITEPLTIIYTGTEGEEITLEETLIPAAFYTNAGAITQLNDILYLADIKEAYITNMQKYANLVRLKWKSLYVENLENNDDIKSGKIRTHKHGEALAGYIVYYLSNGQVTDAFHVPGIAPTIDSLTNDPVATAQGFTASKYQTNTIGMVGIDTVNRTGGMGIWINKGEVYPNTDEFNSSSIGGEDLRGKAVRHHKLPTLQQTGSLFYTGTPDWGTRGLDALGITAENVIIPPELASVITGYEIFYAKRDYSNSTIASQALLTYGVVSGRTGGDVYFSGGNWRASVLRSDFSSSDSSRTFMLVGEVWKVNHPDLMVNRPAITPTFQAANFRTRAGIGDNMTILKSVDEMNFITDFYSQGTVQSRNYEIHGIRDTGYLLNNAVRGNIKNFKSDEGYVGRYNVNAFGLSADEVIKKARETEGNSHIPNFEESYNVDIVTVRDDVYRTFNAQDLVRTGIINSTDAGVINEFSFSGDCFLVLHSYIGYGLSNSLDRFASQPGRQDGMDGSDEDTYVNEFYYGTSGTKAIRRYPTESRMNLWQRYIDPAVSGSRFWTADTQEIVNAMERNVDNNVIAISKESESVGDILNGLKIYNADNIIITENPYKIIRSTAQGNESKFNSWKNYNALDYYIINKNMGRIINLQGMDDRLIIHCRNALFITQDKTTLQGDILSVTLGTGDIFRFPPKQGKTSKLGYAGTQHQLACTLTDYGYIFPDAETGTWFVLNERGLQEMNMGMYNFFMEYLKVAEINPYIGNGICVGYDRDLKRILVTIKNVSIGPNPNYVPNYEETEEFFAKLTPNVSVVFKDGRYQLYKGDNTSDFSCTVIPPPVLGAYTFLIDELTPVGTLVGNIVATGDAPLVYLIMSGNTNGAFSLDSATGNLYVANSTQLLISNQAEFNMVTKVVDTHSGSDLGSIKVTLVAINFPPVTEDYVVDIDENSPVDTNIQIVAATDPKGLTLAFSIESQSVAGAVKINSVTGQISINNPDAFDHEINPFIDVVVKVTNTAAAFAYSNVRIYINNVNEAPIVEDQEVLIPVDATGVVMVYFEPEDPEGGELDVSVVSQSVPGAFTVDLVTREVSVTPDFELDYGDSPYIIVMKAKEVGGEELESTFTLTINIEPPAPEFGNVEKSQIFYRDDCEPGYTGTAVPYIVPANSYYADSQELADAAAQAEIDAMGQNNANDPTKGFCLVNSMNSIALLDYYDDGVADTCLYIDTPGIAESLLIVARNGQNFQLPGTTPAEALLLSSDTIADITNKRRYAFNIGRLHGLYPDMIAIPKFIYKLRGRTDTPKTANGQYSLKDPSRTLIMVGSPGSYMCGAVPAGGPSPTIWTGPITGGTDGTVGISVGEVIATFEYDRAANTFLQV